MNNKSDYVGEMFLDRMFKDLYKSKEVLNKGQNPSQKIENIRKYIDRLAILHKRVSESSRESDKNLLKQFYYEKYLIKEVEIPESYFKHHQQVALERGLGHIQLTSLTRKKISNQIIEEQKKSLDVWIDYFLSDDSKIYPMWAKYWAFQGMLKLGSFQKDKNEFTRRTSGTIAPFVELNQEALSLSIDLLIKYLNKKEVSDKNLEKIIASGVFGRIYAYQITYLDKLNSEKANSIDGMWIKYPQGTDYQKLVKTLQGKGTGWCTAGEETAKQQLELGDFYVYYSYDTLNKPTIPRLAIRMENNRISEIRGIAKNQHVESEMEGILDKKLEEFPDKDQYRQKVNDMKMLTIIYKEHELRDLSMEELRFLYELDRKIIGFGYHEDPRILEIIKSRNIKRDLAKAMSLKEKEIGLEENDIYNNDIIYYHGSLDLSHLSSIKNVKLPRIINGDLNLGGLRELEDYEFPQIIKGNLDLMDLRKINRVKFPIYISNNLDLARLLKIENTIMPKEIGDSLFLNSISRVDDLELPQIIGKNLVLIGLTNAIGLKFPNFVGENCYLSILSNVDGLKLPTKVKGIVFLNIAKNLSNLVLPRDFESMGIITDTISIYPHDFYKYQQQDNLMEEENDINHLL